MWAREYTLLRHIKKLLKFVIYTIGIAHDTIFSIKVQFIQMNIC